MTGEEQLGIDRLLSIMKSLRDPLTGCPWDIKQTFSSIAPYTLEEVYELIECIEADDISEMPSELGDLLFQVVFYAQIASEQGQFDFNTVVSSICDKLLRRHPHVFSQHSTQLNTDDVKKQWEAIKQVERKDKNLNSLMDDIPVALTALQRAAKLQKRAANIGFDWSHAKDVLPKLEEERLELLEAIEAEDQQHVAEELGDMFFTMVNLTRKLKLDPEQMLRAANRKFERRFRLMEQLSTELLSTLDQEQLERLWHQAKTSVNAENPACD